MDSPLLNPRFLSVITLKAQETSPSLTPVQVEHVVRALLWAEAKLKEYKPKEKPA